LFLVIIRKGSFYKFEFILDNGYAPGVDAIRGGISHHIRTRINPNYEAGGLEATVVSFNLTVHMFMNINYYWPVLVEC